MSVSVSLTVYDELGNVIGDGSVSISTLPFMVQSIVVAVLVALILRGVAR